MQRMRAPPIIKKCKVCGNKFKCKINENFCPDCIIIKNGLREAKWRVKYYKDKLSMSERKLERYELAIKEVIKKGMEIDEHGDVKQEKQKKTGRKKQTRPGEEG